MYSSMKQPLTAGIRHSTTSILQQEEGVKAVTDTSQIVCSDESGWERDCIIARPDGSVSLCAIDESYGTIRDGI